MSILEDILAALKENTATLKSLSGKTAAATAPKATAAKTAEAPSEEKRGRGRPPKPKAMTPTQMGEKAREFCEAAGDDEDEFKARRKLVSSLAAEFKVAKFSEIGGDDQAEALAALEKFLEEGDGGDEGDADY